MTEESVEAGGEVWNNYGPKSNEELLINYGFVHPPESEGAIHGDWVRVTLMTQDRGPESGLCTPHVDSSEVNGNSSGCNGNGSEGTGKRENNLQIQHQEHRFVHCTPDPSRASLTHVYA